MYGKTKLTEGILTYFDLQNEISSPTFTIVNEYKKENVNIYHFDLYRLEDIDEFYEIGGEEYFNNGICIVEWGEIIQETLNNNYIEIKIQRDSENEEYRKININVYGEKNLNKINEAIKEITNIDINKL